MQVNHYLNKIKITYRNIGDFNLRISPILNWRYYFIINPTFYDVEFIDQNNDNPTASNNSIVIQTDGKIVVISVNNTTYQDFSIVRFNSNGTLDV